MQPKIGIMTFYAVHNNGAVLQAFALQQKLKQLGADVELIRFYDKHNEKHVESHSRIFNLFHKKGVFTNIVFHFRRYLTLRDKAVLTDKSFSDFSYQYLNTSIEPYYDYADLEDANRLYHGFIVGSDMVWTPIGQDLKAYFLQFADKNKRFSYSPSLTGTASLSDSERSDIVGYLNDFPYLSCREKEGVDFIKEELNREAVHTLDPTMLFDKDDWRKELSLSKNNTNDPYILCYVFGGLSKHLQSEVNRISKDRNLKVRYFSTLPKEQYKEVKNGHVYGFGPKEFVELFLNSSFIVTNTYHGLMFSLISEKPFVLIHRENNNAWKSNEGRMSDMLEKLNLLDRYIERSSSIKDEFLSLDYSPVRPIIQEERVKSITYLNSIIESASKNNLSIPDEYKSISSIKEKDCTGCSACYQVCPFAAISMRHNREGFLYPVINDSRCQKCGLCLKTCPSYNSPEKNTPKASYICISNSCDINKSASGGVFFTLAKYYIEELAGVVYGAAFNDSFECEHIEGDNLEYIRLMQNSKYVQSNTTRIYRQVKEQLDDNRQVLFSGTPCQVAGLLSFLRKPYDNLLTLEIICHGVPSPTFWSKYISNEFGPGSLKEFSFRNRLFREKGSTSFTYSYSYTDSKGEQKQGSEPYFKSAYYNSFIKGYSFRKSCYYCHYAQIRRVADITIGDADSDKLYPEFHPNESKSSVLLNTNKGVVFWGRIKCMFDSTVLDLKEEARVNLQLRMPSVMPSLRRSFYEELNATDWNAFARKYAVFPKKRLLSKINKLIG